jgi:cell wall-associated NlpC family hydrolase
MKTTDSDFPAALRTAAEAWAGTPFRRLTANKGRGVDCANLCYSVLADSGLDMPDMGAPTFGKNADTNFSEVIKGFLSEFVEKGNFEKIDDLAEIDISPGDLILFAVNQRMQHLVVAVSADEFTHVTPRTPAAIGCLDAKWREKIIAHYRLKEA